MLEEKMKRRALVKGAAWAAPVVVASAMVPAYAASTCTEQVESYASAVVAGGTNNKFDIYVNFDWLKIHGVEKGLTITGVSVTFEVQQKTAARGTASVGVPSPSNTWMSYLNQNGRWTTASWAANRSYNFYDYGNNNSVTSWSGNKVTYLGQNRSVAWRDGISRTSWAMRNDWKVNTSGDPRVATVADEGNCSVVGISNLGWIQFQGTYALNYTDKTAFMFNYVVTLSDGTTRTWTSFTDTMKKG